MSGAQYALIIIVIQSGVVTMLWFQAYIFILLNPSEEAGAHPCFAC